AFDLALYPRPDLLVRNLVCDFRYHVRDDVADRLHRGLGAVDVLRQLRRRAFDHFLAQFFGRNTQVQCAHPLLLAVMYPLSLAGCIVRLTRTPFDRTSSHVLPVLAHSCATRTTPVCAFWTAISMMVTRPPP